MAHSAPPSPPSQPLTLHGLSVEGVNQCVHCGLCLAYCPTFSELGTEMDSPRGRIFLVKSLAEGRIGLSDPTVEHLSLCLDCRACETVCPAGVPYGQLIEAAKAEIERQRPGGPLRRLFRWVNFSLLLAHPRLLLEAPRDVPRDAVEERPEPARPIRIEALEPPALPQDLEEDLLHCILDALVLPRALPPRDEVRREHERIAAAEVAQRGIASLRGAADHRPARRERSVHNQIRGLEIRSATPRANLLTSMKG